MNTFTIFVIDVETSESGNGEIEMFVHIKYEERLEQAVGKVKVKYRRSKDYDATSELAKKHLKGVTEEIERSVAKVGRLAEKVRVHEIELINSKTFSSVGKNAKPSSTRTH